MSHKGQNYQSQTRTIALLRDTISVTSHEVQINTLAKLLLEGRSQQVSGFEGLKSVLVIEEEEDIEMKLALPAPCTTGSCVKEITNVNVKPPHPGSQKEV